MLEELKNYLMSNTSISGFVGLKFLHDVHDFPTFYVKTNKNTRVHMSGNVRFSILELGLRVYEHSDLPETIEITLRNLEESVQNFAKDRPDLVEECRVISVKTDEGLLKPYALGEMVVQLLYRTN